MGLLICCGGDGLQQAAPTHSPVAQGYHRESDVRHMSKRGAERLETRQAVAPEHLVGWRHAKKERDGDRHPQALVQAPQLPFPRHDLAAAAQDRVLNHLGEVRVKGWLGQGYGQGQVDVGSEGTDWTALRKAVCICTFDTSTSDEHSSHESFQCREEPLKVCVWSVVKRRARTRAVCGSGSRPKLRSRHQAPSNCAIRC